MTLRRAVKLITVSVLCLTAALASAADGSGRVARIAVLRVVSNAEPLLARLRTLRSDDGKNHIVEDWVAQDHPESLSETAAELVKSKVDVIVAVTNAPAFAAKKATRSIPIVVFTAHDAVGTGLVPSLARPGGNITGTESLAPELDAKRLQLFTQMVPGLRELAVLYNPQDQGAPIHLKWAQSAGQTLGFQVTQLEVRRAADFEPVLRNAAIKRPDGLMMFTDGLVSANWEAVAEFAREHRVPTMCEFDIFVDRGCLMSYGPTLAEFRDRVARQVDRILRGANPADIPFEQPTRLEVVVNKKTAAALGITIPPPILLQASRTVD